MFFIRFNIFQVTPVPLRLNCGEFLILRFSEVPVLLKFSQKKKRTKGLMVFQINDLERTFLTEQQLIAGPDIKLTILLQPK